MEYKYSIEEHTLSGFVDVNVLSEEIIAEGTITGFSSLSVQDDVLSIFADDELRDNITPIVAAHVKLDSQKVLRKDEVNEKTTTLICCGKFTFDENEYSLSKPAQINWLGLKSCESILTWPVKITTLSDEEYLITQANLNSFIGAGLAEKQKHLDSGRDLKIAIDAATDQNELDLIVDER